MNEKETMSSEHQSPNAFRFPEDFEAPTEFKTPNFVFTPLSPAFADVDHKAVLASIETIRNTRGSDADGWPDPNISYEENRGDLERHWQEFQEGKAFAYAVLSHNGAYIGCFYLYPPGHRSKASAGADVDVNFWVTSNAYEAGSYDTLYQDINGFLNEKWPFEKVVLTNKELPSGGLENIVVL